MTNKSIQYVSEETNIKHKLSASIMLASGTEPSSSTTFPTNYTKKPAANKVQHLHIIS
jgi:hypothetical protein